jgi:hypothetical protein
MTGELVAMSEHEQYGELADELADRADRLAGDNKRLGEDIVDVRADWHRKRADANVPGATPDWDDPDEDEDEDEDDDVGERDKDDDADEDDKEDDE